MDGKNSMKDQHLVKSMSFSFSFLSQESVLDQTATLEISQDDENLSTIADCQRFEMEKKKFQVAIDSLDSAVTRLEQLCCTDVIHCPHRIRFDRYV